MKYICSMETVQQNGRFTLFSSKFLSIYSILYAYRRIFTYQRTIFSIIVASRKKNYTIYRENGHSSIRGSSTDYFRLKQQIYRQGMPNSDIRKLCIVHCGSNVNKSSDQCPHSSGRERTKH